ncbi:hypothetical protein PM082_015155 [Marasmius tenuissimus]|nr:hypothetical protein PM082_015155 [Marasmius tenuissimus]
MNNQIPWHECLRLQGQREQQWLTLCGFALDQIPHLVEERCQFQADTIKRYSNRLKQRRQLRDHMLLVLKRRKKVQASAEVEGLVSKMVDMVSHGGGGN